MSTFMLTASVDLCEWSLVGGTPPSSPENDRFLAWRTPFLTWWLEADDFDQAKEVKLEITDQFRSSPVGQAMLAASQESELEDQVLARPGPDQAAEAYRACARNALEVANTNLKRATEISRAQGVSGTPGSTDFLRALGLLTELAIRIADGQGDESRAEDLSAELDDLDFDPVQAKLIPAIFDQLRRDESGFWFALYGDGADGDRDRYDPQVSYPTRSQASDALRWVADEKGVCNLEVKRIHEAEELPRATAFDPLGVS